LGLKLTKKPATATTTTEIKTKGTVVSEESKELQVNLPIELAAVKGTSDPLCEVGVDMSYTHNLGNYTSARVAVSLKVSCLHAEVDEVFEFAKAWTDTKLNGLVAELTGESN
jgi:hypothetical protein